MLLLLELPFVLTLRKLLLRRLLLEPYILFFLSYIYRLSRLLIYPANLLILGCLERKILLLQLCSACPVGIVDTIDNVIDSERDSQSGKIDWSSLIDTMLSLGAFMTINIGIFNLLPLPALDGGRLLFLIIEAVRRKPVKPEHEGMVHAIGMAALLLLMVVVTVSDIIKLV